MVLALQSRTRSAQHAPGALQQQQDLPSPERQLVGTFGRRHTLAPRRCFLRELSASLSFGSFLPPPLTPNSAPWDAPPPPAMLRRCSAPQRRRRRPSSPTRRAARRAMWPGAGCTSSASRSHWREACMRQSTGACAPRTRQGSLMQTPGRARTGWYLLLPSPRACCGAPASVLSAAWLLGDAAAAPAGARTFF